jgi:hypothetical protein
VALESAAEEVVAAFVHPVRDRGEATVELAHPVRESGVVDLEHQVVVVWHQAEYARMRHP